MLQGAGVVSRWLECLERWARDLCASSVLAECLPVALQLLRVTALPIGLRMGLNLGGGVVLLVVRQWGRLALLLEAALGVMLRVAVVLLLLRRQCCKGLLLLLGMPGMQMLWWLTSGLMHSGASHVWLGCSSSSLAS